MWFRVRGEEPVQGEAYGAAGGLRWTKMIR